MLILVTGVSGSGKSEYAEKICCDLADGEKKYYIATMQPFGAEGQERIRRHHALRKGKGIETIEQYQHVNKAFMNKKRLSGVFLIIAAVILLIVSAAVGLAVL